MQVINLMCSQCLILNIYDKYFTCTQWRNSSISARWLASWAVNSLMSAYGILLFTYIEVLLNDDESRLPVLWIFIARASQVPSLVMTNNPSQGMMSRIIITKLFFCLKDQIPSPIDYCGVRRLQASLSGETAPSPPPLRVQQHVESAQYKNTIVFQTSAQSVRCGWWCLCWVWAWAKVGAVRSRLSRAVTVTFVEVLHQSTASTNSDKFGLSLSLNFTAWVIEVWQQQTLADPQALTICLFLSCAERWSGSSKVIHLGMVLSEISNPVLSEISNPAQTLCCNSHRWTTLQFNVVKSTPCETLEVKRDVKWLQPNCRATHKTHDSFNRIHGLRVMILVF